MPLIKVYSNKFSDEAEHNVATASQSFRDYLRANVSNYNEEIDSKQLFSVSLNGKLLPPDRWDTPLAEHDALDVVVEPKGTVVVVATVITVISAIAAIRAMNALNVPDTYNSTTPDSSSIYSVNAQGNKPKLMAPAPVLFGMHKIYPDYLCPSYREYVAHEEWRYFMLSVCAHGASIDLADIRLGDTSIADLGSDVSVSVFKPGDTVTGHKAHRHMYSVAEVDGAGVELKGALPEFEFISPFTPGEFTYQWVVQGDTKKMRLNKYSANGSGGTVTSITYADGADWRDFLPAEYNNSEFVGVVLRLQIPQGGYQYFRVVESGSVASFQRVIYGTWQVDQTWNGFGAEGDLLFGYFKIINTGDFGAYGGWFNCCPPGENTNRIEFDFYFPEGLTVLDDRGIPRSRTVTVEIQYRNGPSGSITTHNETFEEATLDARAWTIVRNVTAGAWQARCRVTTVTHNKTLTKETLMWNGLRSELDTATSYPLTTIAIAIKGTQRLSSVASNKINVKAIGEHPVLNADLTWSTPTPTRSVVSAVGVIAKSAGNTDDQIALAELYRIGQILDSRGDYFDGVFDTETTAWEAIKRVLLIGWAQPVVDYGQIVPVRDAMTTDLGWQFSEQNMVRDLRESIVMPGDVNDKHDGVEVEYISELTYKAETVLVTLPGQLGKNPEKLRIYGLVSSDDTRAKRYGLRHLRTKKYRNRRYEFQTEQDALECKLFDPAQIGWAMPHRSQTGEVMDASETVLRLSEPVVFTPGKTHTIIVSNPEGRATGPYVATAGSTDYEVLIDKPLEFTPEFTGRIERPRYQFGFEGRRSISALINSTKPRGDESAAVVAVINDPRVFDDDDYGL